VKQGKERAKFLSFLVQDQKLHWGHQNSTDRRTQQAGKAKRCNRCPL